MRPEPTRGHGRRRGKTRLILPAVTGTDSDRSGVLTDYDLVADRRHDLTTASRSDSAQDCNSGPTSPQPGRSPPTTEGIDRGRPMGEPHCRDDTNEPELEDEQVRPRRQKRLELEPLDRRHELLEVMSETPDVVGG